MLLTDDLYLLPTKEADAPEALFATCSLCGAYINLSFRAVHSERCKDA